MNWISVKERLPSTGDIVDVVIGERVDGDCFEARLIDVQYDSGEFYDIEYGEHGVSYYGKLIDNVTHWTSIKLPNDT